ncbi:T9SS sorting signal type C domain-containing protein [Flavobacterium sp. B11]|uniref:T9SS sorting signal type C domain-containing protein n=1 Tax=Flavobacterium movens TaxID=214860 RepID=UPI0031D1923D
MMRKLLYSFLFFIYTKSVPQRLFIPNLRLLCVGMFFVVSFGFAQTTEMLTGNGSFNTSGINSITVECWGGGGAGGAGIGASGAGGGGGGGAYTKSTITVFPAFINYSVGNGGTGGTTSSGGTGNGQNGATTTFGSISASGGFGGTRGNSGGGTGGAPGTGGTYSGGSGRNSVSNGNGGGGGSSAGTGSDGNSPTTVSAGGIAPAGGGAGGAGGVSWYFFVEIGSDGSPGILPGGGGGGGDGGTFNNGDGGNGGAGQIRITYCRNFSISSLSNNGPICGSAGSATITVSSTPTGLPVGNYTVTYNTSSQTGLTANMNVVAAGSGTSGTFTATGMPANGTSIVRVTGLALTSGACTTTGLNNSTTVTITAVPTISYSAASFCKSNTTAQSVTRTGVNGGPYSVAPTTGLSINTSTGAITPSTSAAGTYTVSYAYPASGGCPAGSATTSVTINNVPTATPGPPLTAICQSGTSAAMGGSVGGGATVGTWTGGAGSWNNASNPSMATYTAGASESGTITLTLTASNASCANVITTKTITVNPIVAASVSIAANPLGAICSGTSVTFTATPTNGGTAPTYQWTVNGTNAGTGATYSSSALSNNDVVRCVMTSNANCVTGSPATSAGITMVVNPIVSASVSIAASSSGEICSGTPVTFTATPTYGGTAPNYQWKKNGTNVGTGTTYSSSTLANNDVVTCVMISNASPCLTGSPATSNPITMTVNPNLPASVSIVASPSGAICSGTPVTFTATPTYGGAAPVYQWYKGTTAILGATNSTYTSNALANSDVITVQMTSNATCATGSPATSSPITMTVNPNLVASVNIAANPSGAICSGTSVTFTATPTYGGTSPNYQWFKGGIAILGATNSTYTSNSLANSDVITVQMTSNATCVTGSPATSSPLTMTVNPIPATPLTSQNNVSCNGLGSIKLTGLPTGDWKVYLNDQSGAHQYSRQNAETDLTINNLTVGTYDFTVQDISSGCISGMASVHLIDTSLSTEWDGNGWTDGPPDENTSVKITSVMPNKPFESMSATNLTICSLTITATDGDVIIPSEMTLTVTNGITSNGKLVFESGSSLLQGANAVNSGNISYKRKVDLTRYDVVYWGSPVTDANMTMAKFSPNTLWDKYHHWDAASGQWIPDNFGERVMEEGVGYSIRAPQYFSLTSPSTFEGIFVGVPNNGDVSVPVLENKLNFIGNPYPSPISAKELMLANKTQLGSLYFWSHNSPPQIIPGTTTFQYLSSDFVVFNGTGSTRVNDDPATEFKGFIGAGQAFFTISPAGATAIKFSNDLRKASSQNTQFYKPSEASKTEGNRLWLNIANSQGAFKQILIGYVEGATNGIDFSYDATTRGGTTYIDFYSISESRKLTIQGRALPFDDTDVVPLGYKSGVDEKGDRNFTISIDHADGFFATQAVYLEDKALGKIIDLRKENYTFFSLSGSNSTRFSIRYTNKTLGTDDFENLENTVLVSVKDKAVNITSSKETIKEVHVYNVGAQLLYSNNKVNASDLQIKNLHSSDQVLLVKITLENGHTFTKKVIFSNL